MDKACARNLTETIRRMVEAGDGLRALAVCGSWARGKAHADSDLDLLIVATAPAEWRREQGWVRQLPYEEAGCAYRSHRIADYGTVWSAHIALDPDAELEMTFAPLSWTCVDPVDLGTRTVIAGGFEIVVDKDDRLKRLIQACGKRIENAFLSP